MSSEMEWRIIATDLARLLVHAAPVHAMRRLAELRRRMDAAPVGQVDPRDVEEHALLTLMLDLRRQFAPLDNDTREAA